MPFTLDDEIAAVLAAAAEAGPLPVTARGDAIALREATDAVLALLDGDEDDAPDVTSTDHAVTTADGHRMLVRWYQKTDARPGPAVVYFHGGGMVCGSVAVHDRLVAAYVQHTGVPFLAVDYRLAPEHAGTGPVEDGFAAVEWLRTHAAEFGVDVQRIAVMGDSGGGGVAAGVAVAARDRGVPLTRQILIYPMLDDRTLEPDAEIVPFATWTYDNNYTGWHALLGEDLGTDAVSPLAAPARLTDLAGLPPAFLDVGEADIFRDEDIDYACRLAKAGVSVELHVRPGAPHGFERLARHSDVAKRSRADRIRVIKAL